MNPKATTCSHPECTCQVDPQRAVNRDGKAFCSERCADGRGCDHRGCDCGDFPGERALQR
jgi:hypothetical protein